MTELRMVAWLTPKPGKMDQMTAIVTRMVAATREETGGGTELYHWYLDPRGETLMVHEHYRTFEDLGSHAQNVGTFMVDIMDIIDSIKVCACGDVSDAMATTLAGFGFRNGAPDPANCTIYTSVASI